MRSLCAKKLGKCRKARLNGFPLQYPVYAAPLYWLRLDMHAKECTAALGSHKPLNFVGLNPDAGKVSGQRVNLGIATVLHAKGLEDVHRVLHRENLEKGAVKLVEDLMGALGYKQGAVRRPRRALL
jgi:hypothetical protein